MQKSFILNHLGEHRENYFNAVSPPIIQSSNFYFEDLESFRTAFSNEFGHHLYTRGNNPTVKILRQKIAALEHAEDALIFSSGAAAIANAVLAHVSSGAHIVCVRAPYSWTHILLTQFLSRFGVEHSFVDGTSIQEIENAIQKNTKLLYLESPNSITFELQDLEACAGLAKRHNLISIVDNSYASPIFQNPINFGIDIVVHSASKYLNGHSDVVAGVLCSSSEIIKKISEEEYMTLGSIISPHDAFLMIRGLRTLELRLKRCFESSQKLVRFLAGHSKVEKINYPFLESFPQYSLARKQMRGCGGLFSIQIKADNIRAVEHFVSKLKRFLLAVSWGGHESLILPFCTFYGIEGKENTHLPWNLIRFYIGLEDPTWLQEDLETALASL